MLPDSRRCHNHDDDDHFGRYHDEQVLHGYQDDHDQVVNHLAEEHLHDGRADRWTEAVGAVRRIQLRGRNRLRVAV